MSSWELRRLHFCYFMRAISRQFKAKPPGTAIKTKQHSNYAQNCIWKRIVNSRLVRHSAIDVGVWWWCVTDRSDGVQQVALRTETMVIIERERPHGVEEEVASFPLQKQQRSTVAHTIAGPLNDPRKMCLVYLNITTGHLQNNTYIEMRGESTSDCVCICVSVCVLSVIHNIMILGMWRRTTNAGHHHHGQM